MQIIQNYKESTQVYSKLQGKHTNSTSMDTVIDIFGLAKRGLAASGII